jgi:hypothetical protein
MQMAGAFYDLSLTDTMFISLPIASGVAFQRKLNKHPFLKYGGAGHPGTPIVGRISLTQQEGVR